MLKQCLSLNAKNSPDLWRVRPSALILFTFLSLWLHGSCIHWRGLDPLDLLAQSFTNGAPTSFAPPLASRGLRQGSFEDLRGLFSVSCVTSCSLQVVLRSLFSALGLLFGRFGRLLVDFWSLLVPKSSSKGGLGELQSHLFLRTALFHETLENVGPEQHFRIKNVPIFVAKIDPKSKSSRVSGFGALLPSLGVTFRLPWITFGSSWRAFGPLESPKSAQEPPKSSQEHLKSTPRAPQELLNSTHEHPKNPSKPPGTIPRCPESAQVRS